MNHTGMNRKLSGIGSKTYALRAIPPKTSRFWAPPIHRAMGGYGFLIRNLKASMQFIPKTIDCN